MTMTTTTFALLTPDLTAIESLHDLTDAERDTMADRHGARLVWLPMGGEIGDHVTVSEDGEATVAR
jgi:hypothetical protein